MTELDVIDIHVHFGAPPDQESGCYWSPEFTRTAAYLAMLLLTGSIFKKVDRKHVEKHLLKVITGSMFIDSCVLLALDQAFDEQGNPLRDKTHLYVPNLYIAKLAAESDRILLGASIHPFRRDWEDEFDFCLENGAVLCKWIPSSQRINPLSDRCAAFYKRLANHNLPLLYHAGPEYAIPPFKGDYIEYNNPKYLRPILDQGVTVIIAHCAMPYFGLLDTDYQDDFEEFLKLFEDAESRNWKLYADLSAVCSPFRTDYLEKVLQKMAPLSARRLIYASDYPIPLSELCYNRSTHIFAWLKYLIKVTSMRNFLDKNYLIIKEMKIGEEIFTNAARLFHKIKY